MRLNEAVEYFAARDYPCKAGTVRKLVRAGRLKCYRPGVGRGGPMSFTAAELDAFLARELAGVQAKAERKGRGVKAVKPPKAEGRPADWRSKLAEAKRA